MIFSKLSQKQLVVILAHAVFWLAFVGVVFWATSSKVKLLFTNGKRIYEVSHDIRMLYLLLLMLPFKWLWVYGQLYGLVPKLMTNYHKVKTYLLFSLALLIFCLFAEWLGLRFFAHLETPAWAHRGTLIYRWDLRIWLYIVLAALLWGHQLIKDRVANQQLRQQLEREKLATELAFLKAQINPHFLFNTLNNLYGLTRKHPDPTAANSIAQLSKLMRYMLYETNVDEVVLDKEVTYIQNFIKLQQLRISADDDTTINFATQGNLHTFRLAPMLLIPFVENAFKHGISLEQKSVINIDLEVDETQQKFYFNIKNTVNALRATQDNETSGVGIANVQKRLKLLYPNKHKLSTNEKEQWYEVRLELYNETIVR